MFIDIDENYTIDSQEIIFILDFQLLNSSEKMYAFIDNAQCEGKLFGNENEAKSIIITDYKIYFSPFSTISLKKRLNKSSIINKLENYSSKD